MRRQFSSVVAVVLVAGVTALPGCGAAGAWQRSESHESFELPAIELESVLVNTDNGAITVRPIESGDDAIRVEVHRVVMAGMGVDADECLRNIEIVTPVSGDRDEVQEIRWEWKERPPANCNVQVSFNVVMPKHLPLRARTENGEIDVAGLLGDCSLESSNGGIRALAATTDSFSAKTDNGRIQVGTLARDVNLMTQNGSIEAALDSLDEIQGSITTSNGRVRLVVNEQATIGIVCRTDNGAIHSRIPSDSLTEQSRDGRRRLVQKLGRPVGELLIETDNGGITLEARTTAPELPAELELPIESDPAAVEAESTDRVD